LIKKKIEESPRRWYEAFSRVLWAHRISKHSATKVTPFELVFGQKAVHPVEVNLQGCRVTAQEALSAELYNELMMDRIDEVTNSRLIALKVMEKEKLWTARAYNRKEREKSFQIDDMVWKTILPIGS
jgi:hypothetical protein